MLPFDDDGGGINERSSTSSFFKYGHLRRSHRDGHSRGLPFMKENFKFKIG